MGGRRTVDALIGSIDGDVRLFQERRDGMRGVFPRLRLFPRLARLFKAFR